MAPFRWSSGHLGQEAGRTFDAEMAQAVVNQNGAILIPRGSPAELVVTEVSSGWNEDHGAFLAVGRWAEAPRWALC